MWSLISFEIQSETYFSKYVIISIFIAYLPVHFFRAAAMTLRTVLLSLQALLAAAEPDDPQDAVVAKQYKEDPEMFRLTARHWAQAYAGGASNFPIIYPYYSFNVSNSNYDCKIIICARNIKTDFVFFNC